ncbi:MAG: ATP-binding protein [Planctomycetaceae bacterium]|nr:MAG: ATP-binding protein [Planctomycetaceae bacterium]
MSMLKTIQSGRADKPPRILIYGTEGIGKTKSASQAPKPIFVQTEDGLDQIATDRFPLAKSYDDVYAALKDLHDEPHDYETVVVDSLDWLERLIFDRLCDQYGVASIEKVDGGYGKGYTHAVAIWREFIAQLDALRRDRGMVVILIAHSKIERFEDPESTPYDRYSPRLHRHASALVCEWCDAVLFATRKMRVQSEDAGFNRKRSIAQPIGKAGGDRILRCVGGPSCVAKNRYGITDEIPLSWPAFMAALQTSHFSQPQPQGV